MGHGHVKPNKDGSKARCGGPALCAVCKDEFFALYGFIWVPNLEYVPQKPVQPATPPPATPAPDLYGLADPSREGTTVPANWQPVTDKVTLAVLGKMVEEASELANIAARCIIQGVQERDPKTGKLNADALMEEVADVIAAVTHIKNMLGREVDRNRVTAKYAHKAQWHDMLRENK